MMFLHPSRPSDYVIETILLVWFFSRIHPAKEVSRRRMVNSTLVLLALIALYIPWGSLDYSITLTMLTVILRFVLRTILCAVYLRAAKGIGWKRAGYFSCIYTAAFHSYMNFITLPGISTFLDGETPVIPGFPVANGLVCELITHTIELAILWVVQRGIKFNEIREIDSARAGMAAAVSVCIIYAKTGLMILPYQPGRYALVFSLVMVLMHVCLIAMIIFFERFMKLRRDQEDERLQEVSNAYVLKSMQTWKVGQESTRALAHDMKNHLLAIRRLSAAGDEKKVGEYVDELLGELNIEAQSVETGNDLLNGIIAEKAAEAARDGIELSVVLDSSLLSFVSDTDLCTIFGNTLDNAIEASRQVSDPAARYIALRGLRAAGQAIVTITNSCATMPKIDDVLPETTKEGGIHGFGLKNVYRTVKKYGGFLALDTKTEGRFCLSVLLPIPGGGN
jgi:hypothetical protein